MTEKCFAWNPKNSNLKFEDMSILYEILVASLFTALLSPAHQECDDKEELVKTEQICRQDKPLCEAYELS